MIKRILIIFISIFLLAGCLPSPIENSPADKSKQNMISRSLTHTGNTYRLIKKVKAAKKGEKLSIAFVGSSAFVERENETSVVQLVSEEIKHFIGKKENTLFFNFSIYGTNSEFGNIMLKKEVLSKQPDIIFIDYAGFDGREQDDRENFEALVRTCIEQENEPQVVIFINTKSESNQKQDFMEQLAKYYNIPIIDVATAFLPEISSGRMKADELFSTDFKMTENAKKYLADFCTNYIKKASKIKTDKNYTIPQSMYPNLAVSNPKYTDAENISSENDGSYIRAKNKDNKYFKSRIEYLTKTDNIPFIFIVEANNVYIIAPVSNSRKDIFEILINGKKTQEFSTYAENTEDLPKSFKVYSSNKVEKIAVAIQLKEEQASEGYKNAPEAQTEEQTENTAEQQEEKQDKQTENFENEIKKDFEFWGIAYTKNEAKALKNQAN